MPERKGWTSPLRMSRESRAICRAILEGEFRATVPPGLTVGNHYTDTIEMKMENIIAHNPDANMWRELFGDARLVMPGKYTRLIRMDGSEKVLVMSDTPAEIRDAAEFVMMAAGNVLINGLGLGIIAEAVLQKKEVDAVTVIEISPEVAEMVGGYLEEKYGDHRLRIIVADAFDFAKGNGDLADPYDVVWHDIWDNISPGNLAGMDLLETRYEGCEWQGSWVREHCERMRDIEAEMEAVGYQSGRR